LQLAKFIPEASFVQLFSYIIHISSALVTTIIPGVCHYDIWHRSNQQLYLPFCWSGRWQPPGGSWVL